MSSPVNVPLSNLRAVVIVVVVAFHSVLAYLASQPVQPFPFDESPYRWIAFPILDHERWFGFDLFCAWQDVSLMTLMFFLAGLFTPASLRRKGGAGYLFDRWWRIGLPFVLAVAVLSPLAYFASYRATAADPSATAFWEHWRSLPMWPSGPAWFLWQLFALGVIAAGLNVCAADWMRRLEQICARFADRPLAIAAGLIVLSMIAYVPLAMLFTPWEWKTVGPFSLQLSRSLHYLIYFFAAFAIGTKTIDSGFLRGNGPLARNWLMWLGSAVASFLAWAGLTSLTLPDWSASPPAARVTAAFAFPIACATGVFGLLAIASRLLQLRNRLLDSLSANAYGIYLIHYVVVVWLQYSLLSFNLGAIEKAVTVFAGGLTLSWLACAGWATLAPRYAGVPVKGAAASQSQ